MSQEIRLEKDTMIVSETNAKGIIKYVNKDFCKISGYEKDDLIDQPHNIVRHEDMPKIAFKGLWDTITKGEIWNGIVKNKSKSGDYYWVNATVYPVTKKSGKLRYISVRVKPTEKEISQAQELYEKLEGK